MNEYDLDILKLKNQGYCCSQIVLHLALDIQGMSNPGLLRAMSGLCRGFLSTQGPCGALTGAACVIGFYEHALCSFSAKYLMQEDGRLLRLGSSACNCTPQPALEGC